MGFALKANEVASEAYRMVRAEGKTPTVCLVHPLTATRYYEDLGVERPVPSEGFDPAPMIGLMRLIEDDSIPIDEMCALSDEDYLEHLALKAEAGHGKG